MSKDAIQRRYLQLKLSRDRRKFSMKTGVVATHLSSVIGYIDGLKEWLKGEPKRAKRKGGVGQ